MSSIYVFKGIKRVDSSNDMIDIVLSQTQRKTPTEVHTAYHISRIREFYMRKIKYCSDTFCERLEAIVKGFPKLSEIHPFFADWLNVLYDKDHYKIALSQITTTKGVVEKISKDYVKQLKYGDSLYRCKNLKIAALGRMCSAIKRIKPSLEYLEEIRKHISRLPTIDPFLPTVLLIGFPNVGKSSFINIVTKANVEVSPMPFSTQNLFVGHTEHRNVKIQFIDSPGILNRDLESRNNIEMQSITALAHLKTLVLFLIDISETSGYTIEDQLHLYEMLNPLFAKKPAVIALNKIDICSPEQIQKAENLVKSLVPDILCIKTSNIQTDLIENCKNQMCDLLLQHRNANKKSIGNELKTDEDYYRGVQEVFPSRSRDNKLRSVNIPESVLIERSQNEVKPRTTLKHLQEQHGGAGVFGLPWQEHFILEKEEWKYDKVPEIMDGRNLYDYVDPEIEQKILALEEEEAAAMKMEEIFQQNEEQIENEGVLGQVNKKRGELIAKQRMLNNTKLKNKGISVQKLKKSLDDKGKESKEIIERLQEKKLRKMNNATKMEIEDSQTVLTNSARHRDTLRRQWNDPNQKTEVRRRKIQKLSLKDGQKGDADHKILNLKPKHLFSGKRGIGKVDRR